MPAPFFCPLARAATGKAISKQCWNLFPKILKLDTTDDPRVRESHPEVVCARFNNGAPLEATKKTLAGQQERLDLLESAHRNNRVAYEQALKDFLRKAVARDDLIDALVLGAAARAPTPLSQLSGRSGTPAIWY